MRRIYVILIILVLCVALVLVTMNVTGKIQRRLKESENNSLGISQQVKETTIEEGKGIVYTTEEMQEIIKTKKVVSKLGYSMEYIDTEYQFAENELYSRYLLKANPQIYMTVEIYRQYDKIESYFDTQNSQNDKVIFKKSKNKIYRIEMFYPEEVREGARATMLKMIDTFEIL